jgi:DNA (cytosine-5)-methyltransferase 1
LIAVKEKISIEEFDGKNYQIKLVEPYDKALITHYLHNYRNGVSKHYKKDAIKVLNKFVEYKQVEEQLNIVAEDALQQLLFEVENVPFPTPNNYNFKFIDLFAGIGGFRLAMQNVGGKCVFTSEWETSAQKTYRENFGEIPFGDITKQRVKNYIPQEFDVLCAGFPCQAFSIAGNQKGFADTRGTLFFDIEQIVVKHKPKVVFLENVKNLVSHDNGNTFKTIISVLEDKLGYKVYTKILNSMTHANIPQNRERIFIVAFDPSQVENYANFKLVA